MTTFPLTLPLSPQAGRGNTPSPAWAGEGWGEGGASANAAIHGCQALLRSSIIDNALRLLRGRTGGVGEIRREPALGVRERHVLAPRVIFDLVAFDPADREISGFR